MALLTKQQVTRAGLNPSFVAVGGSGDEFVPGDQTYLHVKNGGGGASTVTIVTPRTAKGQAIADVTVSVPAAGERIIGPFPESEYADPNDVNRRADVSCSPTTSVTIACIELSRG